MELKYATQFPDFINYGGYLYIRIVDGEDVLIVPKTETPEGIEKDVVVLKRPPDVYSGRHRHVAGTIDGPDDIKFSTDGWHY